MAGLVRPATTQRCIVTSTVLHISGTSQGANLTSQTAVCAATLRPQDCSRLLSSVAMTCATAVMIALTQGADIVVFFWGCLRHQYLIDVPMTYSAVHLGVDKLSLALQRPPAE